MISIDQLQELESKVVFISIKHNKPVGGNYIATLDKIDEKKNKIRLTHIPGQKYWLDKVPEPLWMDIENLDFIMEHCPKNNTK